MTATSKILSVSPKKTEEENNEKSNLPLSLDSGVSDHQAAARTAPYGRMNQSNEIWIAEFKNKFERLVSIGSLQQQ